jgi:hypothetical protein
MTELDALEAEINALLLKIQNAENIEAAGVYFDQLENIQAVVSGLIFQKQINNYSLASGGFLWYY